MSGPTPFAGAQQYPALYLYALNDSFVPKHISLLNNQHVKIGRQTSAKTVPAERNGYFDSKVLSRQHAEVWEEAGKIYIKDVKSSNGTFINGERLSPEGIESDPYELKSDDIVEFGIDIVGEDNKTIIHHKVAARVLCILSETDYQSAIRAEHASPSAGQPGPSVGGFNFAPNNGAGGPPNGQQNGQSTSFGRRPQIQGMGSLGGGMRAPGKSGLTFEHILSRLQGELQKSRETGAELHNLTGAMGEVGDALGGGLPPALPPYPSALPPVRPAQSQHQPEASSSSSPPAPALNDIQEQLMETQSSLSTHIEKFRVLEDHLAEQAALKREMHAIREMIEHKHPMRPSSPTTQRNMREQHDEFAAEDDDDARSVGTVVPHELESVEEEDEEQMHMDDDSRVEEARRRQMASGDEEMERLEAEFAEERRRRRDAHMGRPRTPEPTGLGMDDEDLGVRGRAGSHRRASLSPPVDHTERLDSLASQLEMALELSRSLQNQHAAAQATIQDLQSKVVALESMVRESRAEPAAAANEPVSEMLQEWKKNVEGQWADVKEEWSSERERLRKAREEWEARVKGVESDVGTAVKRVDEGLAETKARAAVAHLNGDAMGSPHGLVTPPSSSPRSLSADSTRPRHRRRKSSAGRGRSPTREDGQLSLSSSEQSYGSQIMSVFKGNKTRPRSPWAGGESSSDDEQGEQLKPGQGASKYPTPKSSSNFTDAGTGPGSPTAATHGALARYPMADFQNPQVSAALGMVVLSMAAAAVVWRVKPDALLT